MVDTREPQLFVLWTGIADTDAFTVRTPHLPAQTSHRLDSGLCVRVDGDELHRLNRWLYDTGEELASRSTAIRPTRTTPTPMTPTPS